jgi:hypothetical protein
VAEFVVRADATELAIEHTTKTAGMTTARNFQNTDM